MKKKDKLKEDAGRIKPGKKKNDRKDKGNGQIAKIRENVAIQQAAPVQPAHEVSYKGTMQNNGDESLPDGYRDDKLMLLVRDPSWCFAYWDISDGLMEKKKGEIRREWGGFSLVLRMNQVTQENKMLACDDFPVGQANNWYIKVKEPGKCYMAQLGYKTADGHFILIAASNIIEMPNDRVSDKVDEEWMDADDFSEIFRMSTDGKRLGGSENIQGRFTGGSENSLGSERLYIKPEEQDKHRHI